MTADFNKALEALRSHVQALSPEEFKQQYGFAPEDWGKVYEELCRKHGLDPAATWKKVVTRVVEATANKSFREVPPQPVDSKKVMMQIGLDWWPHTYKHTSNDKEAVMRMIEYARTRGPAALVYQMLSTMQLLYIGSARWCDCAFPNLKLGHKLAAAFAATVIPADIDVRPPWPAFVIDLPSNFLYTANEGLNDALKSILVLVAADDEGPLRWNYLAQGRYLSLHYTAGTIAEMAKDDGRTRSDDPVPSPFAMDISDEDARTQIILKRIIVSACLELSDPTAIRPSGRSHNVSHERIRSGKEPVIRVFQFTKAIDFDCREAVGDYLAGDRKSLKLQLLVRGYWRNQPYGPQSTLRRKQWIEPYWRGPDDAPIAVRPHKLREDP